MSAPPGALITYGTLPWWDNEWGDSAPAVDGAWVYHLQADGVHRFRRPRRPGEAAIAPIGTVGSTWYALRPATSQRLRAGYGALAVFTGSSVGALTRVDTPASSDGVEWDANAGETYYVGVSCSYGFDCYVPNHLVVRPAG